MPLTTSRNGEVIPYDVLMRRFIWRQGEHVVVVGPTGSGKTVLWQSLLSIRERRHGYIAVLCTKPKDDQLLSLTAKRYRKVIANNNYTDTSYPRLLIWPNSGHLTDTFNQRKQFLTCLEGAWKHGNWTIVLDELRYIADQLNLRKALDVMYLQSRSSGVSLVSVTQRPSWVPLEAFSQSSHLFFFTCRDEYDLKRIQGLGAANSKLVRSMVESLERYQFVYVNALTGDILISKVGTKAKVR